MAISILLNFCAIWGMSHLETVQAVDTFLVKGYLASFIDAVIAITTD